MTDRAYRARLALTGGLLLGIIGDVVLRDSGAPGINLLICAVALAVVTTVQHRRGGGRLSAEAWAWLGLGVVFAAAVAWRDSEMLTLLAMVCAVLAFALPAARSGAAWLRRSTPAAYLAGFVSTAVNAAAGSFVVVRDIGWSPAVGDPGGGRRARAAAVSRGLALAVPVVVVFGTLLTAADAVFADLVADAIRVDLSRVTGHVAIIGVLTWIATGYLFGFLGGSAPVRASAERAPGGRLGITETAIVLGLLDLLFLTFVVVQFRYLFGGGGLVEVTPGLTYAEYARRGFFELVAVVLLVVPLLLTADALLRRDSRRDERLFRALTGVQVALVLAVAASALERMRLYRAAYGLTEDRFYATALLILIGAVLLWFAATVLRGRRRDFAFGAVAAALGSVMLLHAINPDAVIIRVNAERAAYSSFDVAHAVSLSGDAVPALIASLPGLPTHAQCPIARRLLARWSPEERRPLRGWNWSDARARAAVRDNASSLRRLAHTATLADPAGDGQPPCPSDMRLGTR